MAPRVSFRLWVTAIILLSVLFLVQVFTITRTWHSDHHATNHAYSSKWMHTSRNTETDLYHEQARVVKKVNTCLLTVNVTMNYVFASASARGMVQTLREVIPREFSKLYSSPCWEADFEVSMKFSERTDEKRIVYGNETVTMKLNDHQYMYHLEKKDYKIVRHLQGRSAFSPLVCLPKVFLAGFLRCGSTFLYCLMTRMFHSSQVDKEPHWWIPRGPAAHHHQPEAKHVPTYLFNFLDTSRELASGRHNLSNYHQPLTIDGSPNLMFDWPRWYENDPSINYCLLPAIIPEVLPNSKFIIVMRNPLDVMYSAFWYSCTNLNVYLSRQIQLRGPTIFHDRVATKIGLFNSCISKHSLHACVNEISFFNNLYSPELPTCGRSRLGMALYIAHVQRWLSVVSRDKFLFLTLEELLRESGRVQRELWRFVGYPDAAYGGETDVSSCGKNTQYQIDYHNDPQLAMRDDTREMLTDFFKPYNQMLADLLNDTKFLWDHR